MRHPGFMIASICSVLAYGPTASRNAPGLAHVGSDGLPAKAQQAAMRLAVPSLHRRHGGRLSEIDRQNIRSAGRSVPKDPTFAIARLIRIWLSLRALPIDSLRSSTLNPQQSVL